MGEQLTQPAQGKPRREGPVTIEDVAVLFAWLKSQYGAAWTIEPIPENLRAWHEQLKAYAVSDLRRVCKALQRQDSDYPPSGPKFAKMCKGSIYDQRTRAERWTPPLPPPSKNVELNRKRIAELRRRLNLPRPDDFEERMAEQRDARSRLRDLLTTERVEVSQ